MSQTFANTLCVIRFYEGSYQYDKITREVPVKEIDLFQKVFELLNKQYMWRATDESLWAEIIDMDGNPIYRVIRETNDEVKVKELTKDESYTLIL